MLNKFLFVSSIVLLAACSKQSTNAVVEPQQAKTPVTQAPEHIKVKMAPLAQVTEVKAGEKLVVSKDNWALSIPGDFHSEEIPQAIASSGIEVAYFSADKSDMVTFGTDDAKDTDLENYSSSAASYINEGGGHVLESYSGELRDRKAKLIVFTMGKSVLGTQFTILKDGKAYNLGCFQHASHITKLCFEVANSIVLQ